MPDSRQTPKEWLAVREHRAVEVTPLTGDVSRRAYHRVRHTDGSTSILAVYPPDLRDVCHRFARTTSLLRDVGVRVPEILDTDCVNGFMLLEDAGEESLYDRRDASWKVLGTWLKRAACVPAALARLPVETVEKLSPPLDESLLQCELDQTWDLFFEPYELLASGDERGRLRDSLGEICARLGEETPAVCHRDFMARNLMPRDDGELVVIDHQDLRLGPPAYDLASLLNDSLFPPPEIEGAILDRHLGSTVSRDSYRRCTVQRCLKACGTFAAFAGRGDPRHLTLVDPTLRRAADQLLLLPEGKGLEKLAERWRQGSFC